VTSQQLGRDLSDIWIPRLVGEVLVDALRWAKKTAGPVGPAGFKTNRKLQRFIPTLEDHLEEGWGLPEVAGDEEEWLAPVELAIDPKRADLFMHALTWVGVYLINDGHPATGKILSLSLAHSVSRNSRAFDAALKQEGVSRRHSYRMRDKGLSIIAQALNRDQVPVPERITLSE